MKNKLILGVLAAVSLSILWFIGQTALLTKTQAVNQETSIKGTHIVINEVIPKNGSLLADSKGNYVDLIELYNPTNEPINLEGYGLSDDVSIPHKWVFSQIIIQPDSYLIVYACPPSELDTPLDLVSDLGEEPTVNATKDQQEDIQALDLSNYYTNFKLNGAGERLALSNGLGDIIDSVSFERMDYNMSYGRTEDNTFAYFSNGSPGQANAGNRFEDISDYFGSVTLVPSQTPGIYTQSFELAFDDVENYQLRYTLDGNDPTKESMLYTRPIFIEEGKNTPLRYAGISATFYEAIKLSKSDVNRGVVVKAQYFKEDSPVGEMFVGSYFVWNEGSQRYSMDVVSLTTDSANLFDANNGIYVFGDAFKKIAPQNPDGSTPANYNQRGREWEREAHLEFFDTEGTLYFEQNIGIRTLGGWSRANPKKSFRLFARKEYDSKSSFEYPFFENLIDSKGYVIDDYQNILLRTGGNDWEYTLFRDVLTDELARGILDFQEYKPVILFINGEYWGIYNLREHMDENYIAAHYNIEPKEVAMLAYIPDGVELYAGTESDKTDYEQFLSETENMDFALAESFDYINSKVDITNFIDYYITQIYVNNVDWPGNNSKVWRYTGEDVDINSDVKDGRYRFLLFDTEFNFGLYEGPNAAKNNSFKLLSDSKSQVWPNPAWSTIFFRKFMENETFRNKFFIRMEDLLNSRFEKNRVFSTIKELTAVYEPEMDEYIQRWKFWAMKDSAEWKSKQVFSLYEFATKRVDYLFSYAITDYKLEGAKKIVVQREADLEIRVNDSYDVNFEGASGDLVDQAILTYFSDFPVTFEAIPIEGKQFDRWEIICQEGTWSDYVIEGDLMSRKITFIPTTKITLVPILK